MRTYFKSIAKSATPGVWVLAVLGPLAVAAYPVLFMYFANADEVAFSSVITPLLIFMGVGLALFVIVLLFIHSPDKASIIASAITAVLLNYELIEKGIQYIFPSLRYWHITSLGVIFIWHFGWIVYKMKPELAKIIATVMCVVFTGLSVVNAVVAVPVWLEQLSLQQETTKTVYSTEAEAAERPNIYYIIFDEYAGFDQINDVYCYDNYRAVEELEKLGFSVSLDSHNESLYTETVMTNIVNLEYVCDNFMSASQRGLLRKNNPLFTLLKYSGYNVVGVGEKATFYGLGTSEKETSEVTTQDGLSLKDLIWYRTIIYPFYRVNVTDRMNSIIGAVNYMKEASNFPEDSQFTLCHLECPHPPFIFDSNGKAINYENYMNWSDKQYYLGQYIFSTTLMLETVTAIIANDSDSIIILQSDHGARSYSSKLTPDKYNILNAVYYRGETFEEIKGQSGVNTMRLLLNRLMGKNYVLLDLPEDNYAYYDK